MKKMILISMAVITLLGLMSFTATDETYADFDNSKAVYSGPCGNYSVSVNTLIRMYLMLPENIRIELTLLRHLHRMVICCLTNRFVLCMV